MCGCGMVCGGCVVKVAQVTMWGEECSLWDGEAIVGGGVKESW